MSRVRWLHTQVISSLLIMLTGCQSLSVLDFDNMRERTEASAELTFLEQQTDEFGSYVRTSVELPAEFQINEQPLEGDDRTVTELAVKFASLEGIDSIVLDNPGRWEEWKSSVAPQYFHPDALTQIVEFDSLSTFAPIFFQDSTQMPRLIRDGGVRIADKRFSDIVATYSPEEDMYIVSFVATAVAYSTDDQSGPVFLNRVKAGSRDQFHEDGTPFTDEEYEQWWSESQSIQSVVPSALRDDKVNADIITYSGDFWFTKSGETWMISHVSATGSFDGNSPVSGNNAILGLRNNITRP